MTKIFTPAFDLQGFSMTLMFNTMSDQCTIIEFYATVLLNILFKVIRKGAVYQIEIMLMWVDVFKAYANL